MQKTAPRVFLASIVIVSSVMSVSLLTRGHLWWDDFASYIMQAESLLDGTPQEFLRRNAFTIEQSSYLQGPVAYPWGYPLLIAPVLAVFGLNTLALKFVNTIFFAMFLVVFYQLGRRRLPPAWSLTLTAVLAFNLVMLQAQDLILSDIPFLFFSTLAVFLIDIWLPIETSSDTAATRWDYRRAAALGACIFAAFMLRTNGLLLLAVLAIAQLAQPRGRAPVRLALLPYLVFGLLAVLHLLLLPGGQQSHLGELARITPQVVRENFTYYVSLPAALFDGISFGAGAAILGLVLFALGLFARARQEAVLAAYILLTYGLYIFWPEVQGVRFLFPILPLMLLIAAEGWEWTLQRLPASRRTFAAWAPGLPVAALIVLSLAHGAELGWANLQNGREINGPFDPVSQEMFEFVREQTPPDSVVIFFRPRALRLFTDRDSFLTTSCDGFSQADYMVLHEKEGANGQVAEPEACTNVSLELVFNNRRFSVFEISPAN